MQNRTRNKQLNLKFTMDEYNFLTEKKKQSGINTYTDYILNIAAKSQIININTKPLLRVSYQLSKIGTNINQIAKIVNTNRDIYKNDIVQLQEKIKEMEMVLDEVFGLIIHLRDSK